MFANMLLLALREIRRNALRSSLTMLGIIIGVAAVIILVTLGQGATRQVTQQLSSLGHNLLRITPGQRMGPGQTSGAPAFRIQDVEALRREVADLVAVAPVTTRPVTAVRGNQNWTTQARGTDNQYLITSNRPLRAGRPFTRGELRGGSAVCMIGATVREQLFGQQDPLDEKIRLGKLSCRVIALLQAKGQSTMGTDQDDLVLLPLRTMQRRITGDLDVGMIQVSVRDGAAMEKVITDIERVMRKRRHLASNEENDFRTLDMKEITRMLTGTTRVLTALLGAVAAVSLLVGGIGIMNIMLVSVTERTREIGIRLAIGATERDVLLQFLVEAVVISALGGLTGIILALTASVWLAGALRIPFVFNGGIVVVAFLFSALVGVVFGYFPARRAARLDPIEALRHE